MLPDTTAPMQAQHHALLATLSPAERVLRALTLSAFVRDVAWAGAERAAGEHGPEAVRERFLEQLYGHDMPDALRALLARL